MGVDEIMNVEDIKKLFLEQSHIKDLSSDEQEVAWKKHKAGLDEFFDTVSEPIILGESHSPVPEPPTSENK